MVAQKLKYKNITVSGPICAGTTTLAKLLEKKLSWKLWEVGGFFREYCKKHRLKLEDASGRPDKLSKKIDYGVRRRMKRGKYQVFEGWLTGFMARGIPSTLKVLLVAPDDVRMERVMRRDKMGAEEAKEQIRKREREVFRKWSRLYKETDFWDPKHYDLVIDTYSYDRGEMLEKVLKKLGWKEKQ